MNSNLKLLTKACEELGVSYTSHHSSNNLLEIIVKGHPYIFANWSTPLNPQSIGQLCQDKDYFYRFFEGVMRMPKTKAFLNPSCHKRYHSYLKEEDICAIIHSVEESFSYPLITKRNRGSLGINVFKVEDRNELKSSFTEIFNINSKAFDYVGLAQEFIQIEKEYRAVFLNGDLSLCYEKHIEDANFTGNMSPLHWEGAKAIMVNDEALLEEIRLFCAPMFSKLNLVFCGLDVVLDAKGEWSLIEANSSPGFDHIISSNGKSEVLNLYKKILNYLSFPL